MASAVTRTDRDPLLPKYGGEALSPINRGIFSARRRSRWVVAAVMVGFLVCFRSCAGRVSGLGAARLSERELRNNDRTRQTPQHMLSRKKEEGDKNQHLSATSFRLRLRGGAESGLETEMEKLQIQEGDFDSCSNAATATPDNKKDTNSGDGGGGGGGQEKGDGTLAVSGSGAGVGGKKKKVQRFENFDAMGLQDALIKGVFDYGFVKPSLIQQKAIVPLSKGNDIIAQSQSGTGKTGAFAIGALNRVNTTVKATQILILSPTQHLAQQTQRVMRCLAQFMNINVHLSAGGSNYREDIEALRAGVEVVVGTPGRVIDMLRKGHMKADSIKTVVLDEADEMLSAGFRDDMYAAFGFLPEDIQVALFSATVPDELKQIISELLREPVQIRVKRDLLTLAGIRQYYVPLEHEQQKFDTLCDLHDQLGSGCQTIVFCKSRRSVDWLSTSLRDQDYAVGAIHGEMPPSEREKIIHLFRKGETRVLISSDLLARGIDVQTVTTVLNYDLPRDMENYLHRVGRCGRFGRKGVAINFVTGRDYNIMYELESYYKMKFEKLPSDVELRELVKTAGQQPQQQQSQKGADPHGD